MIAQAPQAQHGGSNIIRIGMKPYSFKLILKENENKHPLKFALRITCCISGDYRMFWGI